MRPDQPLGFATRDLVIALTLGLATCARPSVAQAPEATTHAQHVDAIDSRVLPACDPNPALAGIVAILAGLDVGNEPISALVPDRFDFSEGQTGNNISDGGNNMYDGGNFLNTNLAADIDYTNAALFDSDTLFGPASRYFTAKYTGLFVMVATDISIASFTIEGNNGADGNGAADATVLSTTRGSLDFTIYVKRVYDAGTPSINHIFVVPGDGSGIIQTFSAATNDDFHFLTGLTAIDHIYYLLVARANGLFLDDADIVAITDEFLRVTFDCNGNSVADECDLATGSSNDCNQNVVPDECELDTDGDATIDDCDNCPNEPALADPNEPGTELTCNDFVDNDCDGLTDDADLDCVCPNTCGDIDGNETVNLFDFASFAGCFGQNNPVTHNCICSDLDGSQAINLFDFALFAAVFGVGSTSSPPNCL